MKRHNVFAAISVAGLALAAAPAHAGTVAWFDFESETATSPPRTGAHTSLTVSGNNGYSLTLRRSTGTAFDIIDNTDTSVLTGKPASWGDRSLDPFFETPENDYWIADICATCSLLQHISIEFGDFGQDGDSPVTLTAYDGIGGTGNIVDSVTENWIGSDTFPDFGTLSIWADAPTIRSFTFGSVGSNDNFHNSLFWDNIHIQTPEPGTLTLVGIGLAGLGLMRRRKAV